MKRKGRRERPFRLSVYGSATHFAVIPVAAKRQTGIHTPCAQIETQVVMDPRSSRGWRQWVRAASRNN